MQLLNSGLAECSALFVGRLAMMLIKQVRVALCGCGCVCVCVLFDVSHDRPSPGGQSAGGPPGEHCVQSAQQATQCGHLHVGLVPADGALYLMHTQLSWRPPSSSWSGSVTSVDSPPWCLCCGSGPLDTRPSLASGRPG